MVNSCHSTRRYRPEDNHVLKKIIGPISSCLYATCIPVLLRRLWSYRNGLHPDVPGMKRANKRYIVPEYTKFILKSIFFET
jgi:hypothetical protein